MNSTTKFLLSIEQPLCEQLISYALDQHPEVEVIGHASNFIDTIVMIEQSKPHVWIHSWADTPEYRAILSRVQSIAPTLLILQCDPENPTCYLQVPVNSVQELVDAACRVSDSAQQTLSSH